MKTLLLSLPSLPRRLNSLRLRLIRSLFSYWMVRALQDNLDIPFSHPLLLGWVTEPTFSLPCGVLTHVFWPVSAKAGVPPKERVLVFFPPPPINREVVGRPAADQGSVYVDSSLPLFLRPVGRFLVALLRKLFFLFLDGRALKSARHSIFFTLAADFASSGRLS